MKKYPIFTAALALAILSPTVRAESNVLINSSFESDDGLFPWLAGTGAEVEMVDSGPDGNRSVSAESGYGILRQRVEIGDLGGKRARIRLYAKGENGAKLGVMLFYQRPDLKQGGAVKATSSQVIWNRALEGDWQEFSAAIGFPEGAGGPITLHLFRSNNEGRIWFDNVSLTFEGQEEAQSGEQSSAPVSSTSPQEEEAANLLRNGGFDEDEGQIGFPDHWKQEGGATVRTEIPQGRSRYLRVDGASGGVSQGLDLTNLEKRQLAFHARFQGDGAKLHAWIEGRLSGGAPFRVEIAKEIQSRDRWHPLVRSVKLNVPGKIETAHLFLEKSDGGVLFLEDVSLAVVGLSASDTLALVHEMREWEYLQAQVQGSPLSSERQQAIGREIAEVLSVIAKMDRQALSQLVAFSSRRKALEVETWQAAAQGKAVLAKPALPYERLDPALSPAVYQDGATEEGAHLVGLMGWETPLGFIVTNPKGEKADYAIRLAVNGSTARGTIRRQYFLDTWYTRGRTRMADPMIKLAEDATGKAAFSLEPAETAKFYVEVTDGLKAGQNEVLVELWSGGECVARLPFTLTKHQAKLDGQTLARFDYQAFLYLGHPAAAHFPDLFFKSLQDLGATTFEWEQMPRPIFNEEGKVESLNFGSIENWLERVSKTTLNPSLFWEARTRRWETPSGRAIPQLSPEWKEAYHKIHEEFFALAARHGMGKDRFIVQVKDEPHSQDYANRPDARVQQAIGLLQTFKSFYPEMRTMLTLTDYAFYEDVEALAPYANVALPLWPYRDLVLKFSPEGLNARTEFLERIHPLLQKERQKRGMDIWSYAITSGKQADVTAYHLAYPLMSARMGMTGSSHWAYSIFRGSSWDDKDGDGVDYSMIYLGSETVPENLNWNKTREEIVPSIRWLALREGLRDARLFRTLKAALALDDRPENDALKARFTRFCHDLDQAAGATGYGDALAGWKFHYRLPMDDKTVSEARYWQLRQELVQIYALWSLP